MPVAEFEPGNSVFVWQKGAKPAIYRRV